MATQYTLKVVKDNAYTYNTDVVNPYLKTSIERINQSIFIILTTPIRSRWRRPNFGSNLETYVFELMEQDVLDELIKNDIINSLKYVRDIEVNDVVCNYDFDENRIEIMITYTYKFGTVTNFLYTLDISPVQEVKNG